jgi:hypothetical protein
MALLRCAYRVALLAMHLGTRRHYQSPLYRAGNTESRSALGHSVTRNSKITDARFLDSASPF